MSRDGDSATKQVLELIGLAQDEVDTYYKMTGRGPIMLGEIALIAEISEEKAREIAENLFQAYLNFVDNNTQSVVRDLKFHRENPI